MGPAAGVNCLDWKIRKLDRSGKVLAACGAIELVKDAVFHFPCRSKRFFQALQRIGEQTQGTLARPREAKVGTGSSLAKS